MRKKATLNFILFKSIPIYLLLPVLFISTGMVHDNSYYQYKQSGPSGVYILSDSSFIVFAEMNGQPYMIFADGNIRGIRPASGKATFEFGNAFGKFNEIEGSVRFLEKGNQIIIKKGDVERTGILMKLNEQDKEFKNGSVKLKGVLILPAGEGPFPCLVMTHGSGPEKREASRGLAYLFASNGIAVFIYDKRFAELTDTTLWQASFTDYANDAIAAANLLENNSKINAKKIGIFGHSQGGWVAPLAASRSDLFSYVIISAGNVVTPVEQHLYNGICANRQAGIKEWAIKEIYDFRLIKYEAGITGNMSRYDSAAPIARQKIWFPRTGDGLPGGVFWKSNGYYHSDTALNTLRCPVLVMAGELDKYSDTKTNMPLFQQVFERSGNKNVTYKVFSSANHAYLETTTGKLDETEMIELKRFVPGYFETLTTWLKTVTHVE